MRWIIPWIAALSCLAALGGCGAKCDAEAMVCRVECTTSADCPAGKQCLHEHAHNLSFDICEVPCTWHGGEPTVSCSDSPDLSACKNDWGGRYCPPSP